MTTVYPLAATMSPANSRLLGTDEEGMPVRP
jgi:hypothetical protein